MHRALYRTYRPAVFSDVVGQEHITSVLQYEVENHRTSHAYLFCGSRGTGKTTCAKILAKAVNCLSPENGNPCCKCENCIAVEKGTTTDVLEMDAASNTGVDYIRDIRDAVMYAPAMLKNRVYIIDEVHMLSDGAFNALLKTLEEPPSNVVFILATTEMQKIPSTILSRCQHFEFRRIAGGVIADRLHYIAGRENIDLTDEAAYLIARASQGGMRDAISLLELCSANGEKVDAGKVESLSGGTGRKTVERTVEAIADRNGAEIFSIVSSIYESTGDLGVFWQDLISFYRDMLVYKTVRNMKKEELRRDILDLTESEYEKLSSLADRFRYETLIHHSTLLDKAFQGVSGKNGVSGRISAEMALMRLTVQAADSTPEALAERIAKLEEKLSLGVFTVPADESKESPVKKTETSEKTAKAETAEKSDAPLNVGAQKEEKREENKAIPQKMPETQTKRKELPGFVDVLYSYMKAEPSIASFLTDAKAYEGKGSEIIVTVPDPFALSMLEMNNAASSLEKIVKAGGGEEKKVVFEVKAKEEKSAAESLDEFD